MKRDKQLNILIDKYLSGEATPAQKAALERVYERAAQHLSVDEQYAPEIDNIGRETWNELAAKIVQSTPVRAISWKQRTWVAAAVLALIAMGITMYSIDKAKRHPVNQSVFVTDRNPGGLGATLTLSNGQNINLVDIDRGKLISDNGTIIRKEEDDLITYTGMGTASDKAWHTLSTDSGQTFRIKLADGSIVTLNAASSLRYPTKPGRGINRSVVLSGEGYFDVSSDPLRPFLVNVHDQQIEVLGTKFNVNGYKGEPDIRTVLLEGSVKVTARGDRYLLKPGQQAIDDGTSIRIDYADTESALDWINGEFALNGLDFRAAMRKIARWYQVDVEFDQSLPDNLQTGGWISRDTKLSEVLTLIEKTGQVYFRLEGRKVYVFNK